MQSHRPKSQFLGNNCGNAVFLLKAIAVIARFGIRA
jgi:hypothetical protein